MKFYSIGEFSKLIGRTPQTLRDWDKIKELIEDDKDIKDNANSK